MKTYTVQGETLEDALNTAIIKANGESVWRSVDDCGDTFIDAVAEGEDTSPWGEGALPVPERFTEAHLHAPHGPLTDEDPSD